MNTNDQNYPIKILFNFTLGIIVVSYLLIFLIRFKGLKKHHSLKYYFIFFHRVFIVINFL